MPASSETPASTSSSHYGNVREFDPSSADWVVYKRRLDNYFTVNEITDENKKRAILLNALNEEAYKLIYNMCLPHFPEGKTYDQLSTLFNNHFKNNESVFAARAKFFEAFRSRMEPVNQWAARVRSLAVNCEFNASVIDMMLRDRFVIGFGKGSVQSRLFKEKNTCTFADVINISSAEMAAESSSGHGEMANVKIESDVQHVSTSRRHQKPPTCTPSTAFKAKPSTAGKCQCCGRNNHQIEKCRYRKYSCNICSVRGHLAPMCPNKSHKQKNFHVSGNKQNHFIESDDIFTIVNAKTLIKSPFVINVKIGTKMYSFQLDTGASVSAISEEFYQENFYMYKIYTSNKNLNVYNGTSLSTLGVIKLNLTYNNVTNTLEFFIIKNGGPPILGRDFMYHFGLGISNFQGIHAVTDNFVEKLVSKYNQVFSLGLGKFNKGTVTLNLKNNNVSPKFCRDRPLPFGLRYKVEQELNRLVALNVIKPVSYAAWASPIVPVLKRDGTIRICGDFKITINPHLEIDKFPLPRIEDLFFKLQGGSIFSKIDLSNAYNQICLDDSCKELVTISTHKGLFQYQRLPFGVACAPSKFQMLMESLFQGLEGVACFLDDILICGSTEKEHIQRLESVLQRLSDAGLKVAVNKCSFNQSEIKYLGYVIDKNGLHTSKEKVLAIKNAPVPQNVSQLKSALGMINYYCKFVPNLATILHPLYTLLKKEVVFKWTSECDLAYKKVKEMLLSAKVLVHYNPNLEVKLTTDASLHGLGCILSHVFPDGTEKPIAYASRTLSDAEKNYAQIEREGLAIIFGLTKFNQYLYGREFTLVSDNKPLLAIFNPKKGIPQYSANRLRRWAVILSNYQYKVEYVKSDRNAADFLSRLPINDKENVREESIDIDYIKYFSESPDFLVDFKMVQKAILNDKFLKQIRSFVQSGYWPNKLKHTLEFQPYFKIRNEITVENDILLWNNRVIIPEVLRPRLLQQLHSSHLGIVKMKSLARNHFYWPGLNKDVENLANSCQNCLANKISSPKTTLNPWKWPDKPFERIHIDYLGPFLNKYFLVIVDAHSKWLEVFPTNTITSQFTIKALKTTIFRFGIPKTLVSDNATNFTSSEFSSFLKDFNIEHITSAPYFPQSNGAAENAVKNIKYALKNFLGKNSKINVEDALLKFLFDYRNTPHVTTGVSPALLMFGRDIRHNFDLLRPDIKQSVQKRTLKAQQKQKSQFGGNTREQFNIGDSVYVKDYRVKNNVSWIPGIIKKIIGKCTYIVLIPSLNVTWKRHTNQINRSKSISNYRYKLASLPVKESFDTPPNIIETPNLNNEVEGGKTNDCLTVQRPKRVCKPPDRLTYD